MGATSEKNNNNNSNGVSSTSPSKSYSLCSSPSSPGTPNKKTMEEVWNDLSPTSLQDHSDTTIPNTTNNPDFPSGLIFQDFFARAFNKDPQTNDAASREPSPFGFLASHHGTMLSLNSGSEFQNLERNTPNRIIRPRPSQQLHVHDSVPAAACLFGSSPHCSPFNAMGSSPSPLKNPRENDDLSDDRRHKRLIKNRESAARSRARKQAYTSELELEVNKLLKENAKLRKQQKEWLAASAPLPKKQSLYRTLTAPF